MRCFECDGDHMTVDCPALQPAVIETKQQRWRKRNPGQHRTYMRQYMARRRLSHKQSITGPA